MTADTPAFAHGTVSPVGIGWRHPHYADLLENPSGLDFIEVHSENFFAEGGAARAVLRQGREQLPVSLHGVGLALGSALGIDDGHLDRLARLVTDVEPVRVSDHACFARGPLQPDRVGATAVHAADLLPIPFTFEALDVLCANVQRVQDRLRRSILVENLSAYVHWRDQEMDEVEFLVELVRRSGCSVLLDVNNLFVNALNHQRAGLGGDPLAACMRWLDALPRDSVSEIHLAGHRDCEDIVIDDHGSRVAAPVWRLYHHALRRLGPIPTLIEWDTDLPPYEVLLEEAALARRHAADAASRAQRQETTT
ncbi:DUF692 domain-containing protein [Hydrogenophaga sp.]|uniref:MNIO family bufferin maturase n=1 Tax=Hydrogenophaga sp. TaxID=1904254 RepID=UPI0026197A42|nr:DUF692 domain-containing protein [Hydrogenophaga sp.]MCW5653367.1 DUF692 domain-containing protein [Hydrogenophaga sp.]